MLLNIAIPTYNRSHRLKRALSELFNLILESNFKNIISVYVSNNASTDDTINVLKTMKSVYNAENILFNFTSNAINLGFDGNIKKCFTANQDDYCWFVSDDDNLDVDILKNIISDIKLYNPNIIFYNFNQQPYGKSSPLIINNDYYELANSDFGFSSFIKFPKLTSFVIKRSQCQSQIAVLDFTEVKECAFSHIALALQTAFHCGKILLSKNFSASPDINYRDHIDFPPYVGNKANEMLAKLFKRMERNEWVQLHSGEYVDVAISSLEWLTDYYKGRAVVSTQLRSTLIKDLKMEIFKKYIFLLFKPKFIRRCLYLLIAVISHYFILFFFNKSRILNDAVFN